MPLEPLLASLRPGGRDFERLCQWLLGERARVPRVGWSASGSGTSGRDGGAATRDRPRRGGSRGRPVGGPGEALRPGVRDQEGRPRLVPAGVVARRVHLPAADRDDRSSRPDGAADARRSGEAGRDAAALGAWRARRRVAALAATLASGEAEAEEAAPAPAQRGRGRASRAWRRATEASW